MSKTGFSWCCSKIVTRPSSMERGKGEIVTSLCKILKWLYMDSFRNCKSLRPVDWRCPSDSILNHLKNGLVMIDRISLMSRSEIKDLSPPTVKAASTSEYFSPFKPAYEYKFIRPWNIKELAVHLSLLNLEVVAKPLSYRMPRGDHP